MTTTTDTHSRYAALAATDEEIEFVARKLRPKWFGDKRESYADEHYQKVAREDARTAIEALRAREAMEA